MKMLQIDTFPISGLKLVTLKKIPDPRGFFVERFRLSKFTEAGLPTNFVQDNFSRSAPGILRGLHYQWDQPQGKLVTCMQGRIFDVAVDLRVGSPTFGQSVSIELDGSNPQWFWVPAGFAHGFCVIGNQDADIFYKCTAEYNPKGENGIRWSDPALKIKWPTEQPHISGRDDQMGSLEDYLKNPHFHWSAK
jgi:dTDP-4-dehydrorhamnose 3,5-epimerase